MEEDEDPEDMVAMMEQSQWTGRGMTEPQMSPSLQQMFALVRRMGYEMHPIAHRSGTTRQTPNSQRMSGQNYSTGRRLDRDATTRSSSASAVVRWATRKPGAPNLIIHFPSRLDGWNSQPSGIRQRPDGPQQGNDI